MTASWRCLVGQNRIQPRMIVSSSVKHGKDIFNQNNKSIQHGKIGVLLLRQDYKFTNNGFTDANCTRKPLNNPEIYQTGSRYRWLPVFVLRGRGAAVPTVSYRPCCSGYILRAMADECNFPGKVQKIAAISGLNSDAKAIEGVSMIKGCSIQCIRPSLHCIPLSLPCIRPSTDCVRLPLHCIRSSKNCVRLLLHCIWFSTHCI